MPARKLHDPHQTRRWLLLPSWLPPVLRDCAISTQNDLAAAKGNIEPHNHQVTKQHHLQRLSTCDAGYKCTHTFQRSPVEKDFQPYITSRELAFFPTSLWGSCCWFCIRLLFGPSVCPSFRPLRPPPDPPPPLLPPPSRPPPISLSHTTCPHDFVTHHLSHNFVTHQLADTTLSHTFFHAQRGTLRHLPAQV